MSEGVRACTSKLAAVVSSTVAVCLLWAFTPTVAQLGGGGSGIPANRCGAHHRTWWTTHGRQFPQPGRYEPGPTWPGKATMATSPHPQPGEWSGRIISSADRWLRWRALVSAQ